MTRAEEQRGALSPSRPQGYCKQDDKDGEDRKTGIRNISPIPTFPPKIDEDEDSEEPPRDSCIANRSFDHERILSSHLITYQGAFDCSGLHSLRWATPSFGDG